MTVPSRQPSSPPPAAAKGIVAELKARLGEGFALFQAVSIRYQRGEATAEEYYDLAVDILGGDAASLMLLVAKLPDADKRNAVQQCHQVAVTQLEQRLLVEEQLAAQAAATATWSGRQDSQHRRLGSDTGGARSDTEALASGLHQGQQRMCPGALQLHSNVHVDEDVGCHTVDDTAGVPAGMPGGGSAGVRGPLHSPSSATRAMCNADGQPLGSVITQIRPPWDESSASAAAKGRHGTYQQLAAARRSGRGGAAEWRPAVVPSSTPWVKPTLGSQATTSAADEAAPVATEPAAAAACCLSTLGLGCGQEVRGAQQQPSSSSGSISEGWSRSAEGATNTSGRQSSIDRGYSGSSSSRGASSSGISRRPVIVWFRRDLRLADNPALHHAAITGRPVLPAFIWAPQECGRWPPGGAAQYWLHHSLTCLDSQLQQRYGTRLRCFDARGSSSAEVLQRLVQQTRAVEVVWCKQYEPWCLRRDAEVELALTGRCQLTHGHLLPYHDQPRSIAGPPPQSMECVVVRTFNGSLLYEPWDAAPDQQDESIVFGGYGSVGFFTSSCLRLGDPAEPLPAPNRMAVLPPGIGPPGCSIAALGLADLPSVGPQQVQRTGRQAGTVDWAAGIRQTWRFGEVGAVEALEAFLEEGFHHFDAKSDAKTIQSQRYEEQEELPPGTAPTGGGRGRRAGPPAPPSERFRADKRYTARISPYMAWGELSPRQVYHATLQRHGPKRAKTFLRRLAWRDLAYWMLWRFPWLPEEPLRPQYAAQRWDLWWRGNVELLSLNSRFRRWQPEDPRLLAWQRGQTGFPLVDAGMRELWHTGYCPNYVRHIVAGFLIQYLNIDWRHGCLWFHDTLVDADVAINAMMWQNGGHSGCDQWNFVMHPVYAAKAADPEGDYVQRWCPELARLAVPYIHAPWEAPTTVLAAAGVTLGRQYPRPIIADLEAARRSSLEAVVAMRYSPTGRKYVLPDGHDALPLPDGRFARAITRVDYRQMADQPVTKQAALDLWDKSRRPLRDPMAVAMQETLRGSLGRPMSGGRGMG